MNHGLNESLARAREERPPVLPAGFSDEVMARIARASVERSGWASRKGYVFASMAAVLAAAAVSLWTSTDRLEAERPPMAVFGASGGGVLIGR